MFLKKMRFCPLGAFFFNRQVSVSQKTLLNRQECLSKNVSFKLSLFIELLFSAITAAPTGTKCL